MIDRDRSSSNDSLGQCIVELTNMDPERGVHGSYALADLVSYDDCQSLTIHSPGPEVVQLFHVQLN